MIGDFKLYSVFGFIHNAAKLDISGKLDCPGTFKSLEIPDTITFVPGHPGQPAWYFSSQNEAGMIRRKNTQNVTPSKIIESFTRRSARRFMQSNRTSGIVAVLVSDARTFPVADSSGDQFNEHSVEYLDEVLLREFLDHRAQRFCGLLQKWVEPQGAHNSTLYAVWTPSCGQVTCRTNIRQLADRRSSMHDRAVTFDGVDSLSRPELVSPAIREHVLGSCASLVDAIEVQAMGRESVRALTAYFKLRQDGRLVLLWCSSVQYGARSAGLVPSRSRTSSPVYVVAQRARSQQANVYVCPLSNKVCSTPESTVYLSYKAIIAHWDARRAAFRAAAASSPSIRPASARSPAALDRRKMLRAHSASAANVVEARPSMHVLSEHAGGEMHSDASKERQVHGKQRPEVEEEGLGSCIPPLIRRVEGLDDESTFCRLLNDPAFLYKQVRLSLEAAAPFLAFQPTQALSGLFDHNSSLGRNAAGRAHASDPTTSPPPHRNMLPTPRTSLLSESSSSMGHPSIPTVEPPHSSLPPLVGIPEQGAAGPVLRFHPSRPPPPHEDSVQARRRRAARDAKARHRHLLRHKEALAAAAREQHYRRHPNAEDFPPPPPPVSSPPPPPDPGHAAWTAPQPVWRHGGGRLVAKQAGCGDELDLAVRPVVPQLPIPATHASGAAGVKATLISQVTSEAAMIEAAAKGRALTSRPAPCRQRQLGALTDRPAGEIQRTEIAAASGPADSTSRLIRAEPPSKPPAQAPAKVPRPLAPPGSCMRQAYRPRFWVTAAAAAVASAAATSKATAAAAEANQRTDYGQKLDDNVGKDKRAKVDELEKSLEWSLAQQQLEKRRLALIMEEAKRSLSIRYAVADHVKVPDEESIKPTHAHSRESGVESENDDSYPFNDEYDYDQMEDFEEEFEESDEIDYDEAANDDVHGHGREQILAADFEGGNTSFQEYVDFSGDEGLIGRLGPPDSAYQLHILDSLHPSNVSDGRASSDGVCGVLQQATLEAKLDELVRATDCYGPPESMARMQASGDQTHESIGKGRWQLSDHTREGGSTTGSDWDEELVVCDHSEDKRDLDTVPGLQNPGHTCTGNSNLSICAKGLYVGVEESGPIKLTHQATGLDGEDHLMDAILHDLDEDEKNLFLRVLASQGIDN